MYQPQELKVWNAECGLLLSELSDPLRIRRMDEPITHQWESADRQETHTMIAWSGDAFHESLGEPIHDCIREIINADRGRRSSGWTYQLPFYQKAYCEFFGHSEESFPLNAVFITPSHIPFELWPQAGRKTFDESWSKVGHTPSEKLQQKYIDVVGMSTDMRLDLSDSVWVVPPDDKWNLAVTRTTRFFNPYSLTINRMFQMDYSEHVDEVNHGHLPAFRESWVKGDVPGRSGAPLIQLFRLDCDGWIDLLLFEVSHASGLLADIRWSRQSLESTMIPHPDYAVALRETLASNRKLIRR